MAIKAKKMVDIKVQREMNEFSHPWVDFSGLSKDHSHFDMFMEENKNNIDPKIELLKMSIGILLGIL